MKTWLLIPTGISDQVVDGSYAVIAALGIMMGPIPGCLVGIIGHVTADIVLYNHIYWCWVICSGLAGFGIGLGAKWVPLREELFSWQSFRRFQLIQVAVNVPIWFVLAPILGMRYYGLTKSAGFAQGIAGGLGNMTSILLLGSVILTVYSVFQVDRDGQFVFKDDDDQPKKDNFDL